MNDLLSEAIWIAQNCIPPQGYIGAFSGGKDSIALHRVMQLAGVEVEWHYHNTTIDPPEVVYFMREHYPHVIVDKPRHGNFFHRMKSRPGHVIPSRKMRWCCDEYKEARGPKGCVWLTGVRREESAGRSALPAVGTHTRTSRVHVRPLINWDTEYLWQFIREQGLAYPSLYDEGFHRLGCVGCPLASAKNKIREMERWPRIEAKWKDAIRHCWNKRAGTKQKDGKEWIGSAYISTWEEFYDAWLNDKPLLKKQGHFLHKSYGDNDGE